MNARISAMICLLCVLGSADLSRAEDPYSQRVADPYALSPDPPTMSSGTPELYMSFLTGYANTSSADATFTDGTQPTIVEDVDYKKNFSVGGNLGIWFPTRNKLAGFDLGMNLNGFLWQADVSCCRENFNGVTDSSGLFTGGGTEIQGLYIGPNFLVRYPMAISEAYPNGRWHPYVGIGVGMHQMAMRPGGSRGQNQDIFGNGNPITDQRSTSVGWMAVGGVKAHLFKYVAAFAEAKYLQAHHDGLTADRFGQSGLGGFGSPLVVNQYSSSINTILVHVGLSIHFDWKP
jgi:opacity protein-like surface antigen